MGNQNMSKKKVTSKKERIKQKQKKYKELLGQLYTQPTAACSIALSALHSEADSATLSKQLAKRTKEVIDGDLSIVEAMLIDQAYVLQSIFINLTMNMNQAEYISGMEAYAGKLSIHQTRLRQPPENMTGYTQDLCRLSGSVCGSSRHVKPLLPLFLHEPSIR